MLSGVAYREDDVVRSLRQLGVTREDLFDAARYGAWARGQCHPFDAPTYAGLSDWNHRMRRLGIIYVPQQWKRVNDHGVPFILSPDGKVAITTARGNEDTGNPNRHPETLFPKGGVAITLARQNRAALKRLQPDLSGFAYEGELEAPDLSMIPDNAAIYYLLVHHRLGNIVAELSEPVRIDDESHFVVEWNPRILLGSVPIGEPKTDDDDDDDEGGAPFDIDVTPRDGE